jgi:hypothetical protein
MAKNLQKFCRNFLIKKWQIVAKSGTMAKWQKLRKSVKHIANNLKNYYFNEVNFEG